MSFFSSFARFIVTTDRGGPIELAWHAVVIETSLARRTSAMLERE